MRFAAAICALLLVPACKDDKPSDKKEEGKADGAKAESKKDDGKKDDGKKDDGKKGDGGDTKVAAEGGDEGGGEEGGDTPAGSAVAVVKLVPEAATVMGGLDLAAIVAGPSWDKTKESFDANAKDAIEVATKCKVGPKSWKTAVIGADPNSESVVMALEATGIGKKDTLDCIHKEVKAKNGQDPWTASDDGKTLDMGDGAGHVVSDDLLVFASATWNDSMKDLIAGKGHAAADGALKSLIDRTDSAKHVWFAGRIPADMAGMAALVIGTSAKDVSGWIDLSAGLELSVMVGVDDATTAKTTLDGQWAEMKPSATAMGVPKAVVDSVKIGTKDGALTLEAKASAADLDAISKLAGSAVAPPM